MEKRQIVQMGSENNKLICNHKDRLLVREAVGSSENIENNYHGHRISNIIVEI